MISVVIGVPEAGMIEAWEDLRQRAGANVFMHPAALCAAAALGFAQIYVLQAFTGEAASRQLVGFWALRERRTLLGMRYLAAPPYEYAFVSDPVIDPAHAREVMPAFFDAIRNDPALPNVIQLKLLDGEADATIAHALGAERGSISLSQTTRPFLNGPSERKRSGSTGKKLRQDWNRLGTLGAVDVTNDRSTEGACAGFETFLQLEARSWKGTTGTALLSHDRDAAFTRRLIGDLGERGCASVALLRVDGKPVAAQVLLYSGTMAYTWKTAFDAEFAKFSPGALLIDKVTDDLFAAGVVSIESCSPEGSFMEHLWTGRRATHDLLVDVGARRSLGFAIAALGERGYAWLREARNWMRATNWRAPQMAAAGAPSSNKAPPAGLPAELGHPAATTRKSGAPPLVRNSVSDFRALKKSDSFDLRER